MYRACRDDYRSPGRGKSFLMVKQKIIRWMVKNNVCKINDVGKLIREYYSDPQSVIDKTGARENA